MKMIVAMSEDGIIGVGNRLPWKVPSELRLFKSITKDNTIIMGRKTYDSLPSKPLQGRLNVVVSRSMPRDTRVITERLASRVGRYRDAFIIGGASIYRLALEEGIVDEIYMTIIHKTVDDGSLTNAELTRFPWSREKLFAKYQWNTRTHFKAREGDECNYSLHHLTLKQKAPTKKTKSSKC